MPKAQVKYRYGKGSIEGLDLLERSEYTCVVSGHWLPRLWLWLRVLPSHW